MSLVTADAPTREQIMDGTYPIWGEGLTREAYSRWNQGQMETAWGRGHLRRVALVEEGKVLASAKRYDFEGRLLGQPVGVLGIGAVFTSPEHRGRGHAASLIDAMTAEAEERGCAVALLFSEIGARYYETLGFRVLPRDQVTIAVKPFTGSPAMLVRSGEPGDLATIAEISARYAEHAAFALERTPDLLAFGLARKRLLAGLGAPGVRQLEFFVAEEGMRAAAYVVMTRGPHGWVLEDCGDRDPSGARIGAMLQVLSARSPADPPLQLRGWLPDALRPPQVRVDGQMPSKDVMMWRPLGTGRATPDTLAPVVYWPLDLF
jgi:predicted N-acetyltransferase YhbS